ncbi:hypothetical protein RB195_022926 [Necator americanus]|uniref:Integrase catalytic domain-containing protein n=1 Tax=Necator americanus TaxID=51031 RepID=A0ABR1EJC5_NECAM
MFVSDEEVGHTFAYWYKRYGPVIRDSVLPDSKKRDLVLMKLDEDTYRKYPDDILPKQPHEIDFETTVTNLEKLFASKKALIRRRYECLRINCPPMTASYVSFRDYANMIKRMDEEARLKELDYTALKTLQFVAGLQDPSLCEVRLRMLRRLDTHTEESPLTIEHLVAECENFTALKMDNTDMEEDATETKKTIQPSQEEEEEEMLARGYAYWTNINRDIEEVVRHCRNYQEAAKMPKKTVLNSWTSEKKPWDRIHIDYVGPLNGRMYLVVVDAYSKWPEVFEMSSSSSTATLRELRMLFSRFGNPRGIEHVRSPPFHLQSNGQVERFVDTLKRTLQKIKEGGTSKKLAEFLQCYRRTPCASTPGHLSPAEVFLRRQLRMSLTLLKESAKEEGTGNVEIEEQFNRRHGAQKRSYHQEELVWIPLNQEDRRYNGMARTIADFKDNVKDRAQIIVPPTTTRPARQCRPPRRLQPDLKMKTYAMCSS